MSYFSRLQTRSAPRSSAKMDAVYARTAADDEAGTACQRQVREALRKLGTFASPVVYADARTSGLDADRPALRRLLADVRRGRLHRVVVRDLSRLSRNTLLLEAILGEFRAADVDLVTIAEAVVKEEKER